MQIDLTSEEILACIRAIERLRKPCGWDRSALKKLLECMKVNKCCLTCQRMPPCPIIVLWASLNDNPMIAHNFYCSEYLRQEVPK